MIRVLNARTAAVGVGEFNESISRELEEVKKVLQERTNALQEAQQEIQMLKQRQVNDGA